MHGLGLYEWPDGKKHEGFYKENNMNGRGKIIYPNGSIYEGSFENDLKHGFGI